MNDTFYEHIVQRKVKMSDILIKVLLIVVTVVLAVSSMFFGMVMIFAAVAFGLLAKFLIMPRLNVEFEYALLNHELNIDKIYNREKRKNLFSIDLKDAEVIAPMNSHRLDSYHSFVKKDCSMADDSQTPYAVMCNISGQMNCILINPDEHMLDMMQTFLPRTMFRD